MLHLLYSLIDAVLNFIVFHLPASCVIAVAVFVGACALAWFNRKDKSQ